MVHIENVTNDVDESLAAGSNVCSPENCFSLFKVHSCRSIVNMTIALNNIFHERDTTTVSLANAAANITDLVVVTMNATAMSSQAFVYIGPVGVALQRVVVIATSLVLRAPRSRLGTVSAAIALSKIPLVSDASITISNVTIANFASLDPQMSSGFVLSTVENIDVLTNVNLSISAVTIASHVESALMISLLHVNLALRASLLVERVTTTGSFVGNQVKVVSLQDSALRQSQVMIADIQLLAGNPVVANAVYLVSIVAVYSSSLDSCQVVMVRVHSTSSIILHSLLDVTPSASSSRAPAKLVNSALQFLDCVLMGYLSTVFRLFSGPLVVNSSFDLQNVSVPDSQFAGVVLDSLDANTNRFNVSIVHSHISGGYSLFVQSSDIVEFSLVVASSTLRVVASTYFSSNAVFYAIVLSSGSLTRSVVLIEDDVRLMSLPNPSSSSCTNVALWSFDFRFLDHTVMSVRFLEFVGGVMCGMLDCTNTTVATSSTIIVGVRPGGAMITVPAVSLVNAISIQATVISDDSTFELHLPAALVVQSGAAMTFAGIYVNGVSVMRRSLLTITTCNARDGNSSSFAWPTRAIVITNFVIEHHSIMMLSRVALTVLNSETTQVYGVADFVNGNITNNSSLRIGEVQLRVSRADRLVGAFISNLVLRVENESSLEFDQLTCASNDMNSSWSGITAAVLVSGASLRNQSRVFVCAEIAASAANNSSTTAALFHVADTALFDSVLEIEEEATTTQRRTNTVITLTRCAFIGSHHGLPPPRFAVTPTTLASSDAEMMTAFLFLLGPNSDNVPTAITTENVSRRLVQVHLIKCNATFPWTTLMEARQYSLIGALNPNSPSFNHSTTVINVFTDQLLLFGAMSLLLIPSSTSTERNFVAGFLSIKCSWWGRHPFSEPLDPLQLALRGAVLRGGISSQTDTQFTNVTYSSESAINPLSPLCASTAFQREPNLASWSFSLSHRDTISLPQEQSASIVNSLSTSPLTSLSHNDSSSRSLLLPDTQTIEYTNSQTSSQGNHTLTVTMTQSFDRLGVATSSAALQTESSSEATKSTSASENRTQIVSGTTSFELHVSSTNAGGTPSPTSDKPPTNPTSTPVDSRTSSVYFQYPTRDPATTTTNEARSTIAFAVSVLSGGGGVGASALIHVSLSSVLARCAGNGEEEGEDVVDVVLIGGDDGNLFHMHIGHDTDHGYGYRGVLISMFVFAGGSLLIALGWCAAIFLWQRGCRFEQQMRDIIALWRRILVEHGGLPGWWLAGPCATAIGPLLANFISLASVSPWDTSSTQATDATLVIIAAAVVVTHTLWCWRVLLSPRYYGAFIATARGLAPELQIADGNPAKVPLQWLLSGAYGWAVDRRIAPTDDNNTRRRRTSFVGAYGDLFNSMVPRYYWWFLVEATVTIVIALLAALPALFVHRSDAATVVPDVCRGSLHAATAVQIAQAAAFVLLQPIAVRWEAIAACLSVTLGALAALLMSLESAADEEVEVAATVVSVVQIVFVMTATICAIAEEVYAWATSQPSRRAQREWREFDISVSLPTLGKPPTFLTSVSNSPSEICESDRGMMQVIEAQEMLVQEMLVTLIVRITQESSRQHRLRRAREKN
ncbi:transmembrane protein, putative [Bodo saltans]|uniref:Transmembrane protein, putative n=1 Tax=Bodo saltans TaxID=75058 RepID=A0A0S4IU48_BODSA|nr:transmembrane protein, putative [Bodo saltans]|eukprot:CUF93657.1 transmembrane protein, putative [Bodo saltans]